MAKEMCSGGQGKCRSCTLTQDPLDRAVILSDREFKKRGCTKKVKVTCPVCGRRLIGWNVIDHDAMLVRISIPMHKPKGWWKKNKKKIVKKAIFYRQRCKK